MDKDQVTFEPTSLVTLHLNQRPWSRYTKDVEVYNAIFKSLKEHLFEV